MSGGRSVDPAWHKGFMANNQDETDLLLRTSAERSPELVTADAVSSTSGDSGSQPHDVSFENIDLANAGLVSNKLISRVSPPLPEWHKDDPDVNACLCRPLILLGTAIGSFGFLAIICALASTNLALLAVPFGIKGLVFFGMLFLGGALFLSVKLRSRLFAELFLGICYPVACLTAMVNIAHLRRLSLLGIGAVCEATSDYRIAVACYAEFIRGLKPFERDSSNYTEYARALVYAGRPEEAIRWASALLNYFRFVTSRLRNKETLARLARSAHTLALVYELTGDDQRAHDLRRETYEMIGTTPVDSEAHLLGLLCQGEALIFERNYDQAIVVLREFIQNVSACRFILHSSGLMSRAYTMLAIGTAHSGDCNGAWKYARAAEGQLHQDFASSARVEEALMNAELHEVLGSAEMAQQVLETTMSKLKPAQAPLLLERLENKRQHLIMPPLACQNASLDSTVFTLPIGQVSVIESVDHQPSINESKTKLRVLPRTGRFSFMVKMVLGGTVITPLLNGTKVDWHLALAVFIVVAVVLCILRVKQSQSARATRKTISASAGQAVSAQSVHGSDGGVQLYDATDKFLGTYYANEGLIEQCQTLSVGQKFEAIVYSDSTGKFRAIEVFGYYSALNSSPMISG